MEALGAQLVVDAIDRLDDAWIVDTDVVILSKCTDVRAVLAAEYLRERGVIVGVDMFDDYFSQGISPSLQHREFLRQMTSRVDFFLCSTERMREVVAEFAQNIPSHVLNDPFDQLDRERLATRLAEKSRRALESRRIDVLWFGIGDNPMFPVGLADLAAFGTALQPLASTGFDVHVNVVTNLRALHAATLAQLRGMGLQLQLEEWTEERERTALDEALVSFLPVNHQNFSIAKSLNRGISALTGGTQILSAGFDLYGAIRDFRYRDARDILSDLETGSLKLRPDTVTDLASCMDALADPGVEAKRLLSFLGKLNVKGGALARRLARRKAKAMAVLHGSRTSASAFSYCSERAILSIGTPFSRTSRRLDVLFSFDDAGENIEIRLSKAGIEALQPEIRKQSCEELGEDSLYPFILRKVDHPSWSTLKRIKSYMIDTRAGQMIHYVEVMNAIEAVCADILPDTVIYRSELQSPLMGLERITRVAEMS